VATAIALRGRSSETRRIEPAAASGDGGSTPTREVWHRLRSSLWPRRLRTRLLLSYIALVILGLGGLLLWTGRQLGAARIEQAEHELELEALLMANALQEPLEKWQEGKDLLGQGLQRWVQAYAQSLHMRVTVLNPELLVIFSSDETVPAHFEDTHPEIVAARARLEQHDIRWDEWNREERLFVAAPVLKEGKELIGILQLSVPTAPLYADIRVTWLRLTMTGGIILLLTVLVSLVLARQVVEPIGNMTKVTEAIAAGDLNRRVELRGPDEIRRLGDAFNRMTDQVQAMLLRQQAFVSNASHELRSPLTSLWLRVELLQRHGWADPALAQNYLREIEKEITHMGQMVEHLLMLSRLDEGKEWPRTTLDLAPLLYELADEMTPLLQASGLHLELDVPPHLPPIIAGTDAMRIVLRNLLDNAIKYTPSGGRIRLEGAVSEEKPRGQEKQRKAAAPQTASSARRWVVLKVIDTGRGIAAEDLPHIFERFYRGKEARLDGQSGAGLGLALVRAIVESLGGRITVESSPGQGSCFSVWLPITEA
jgi:two-component system OmpR family sensor kinase